MALALRGAAVVPVGNPSTGFTVGIPSAVVAGDLCFLALTSRDSTGAGSLSVTDNDTGGNTWTKIGNSTDHKATLWAKRATSDTASKTVTVANAVGSCSGVLKCFSGGETGDPFYTDVTVESNASSDETAAGITPDVADCMVCASIHNYNNDNAVTSLTSENLGAFTTTEKTSNAGSDCGCAFGHALQSGGPTATGNTTWAQTDGTTYTITWAIKPESAVAKALGDSGTGGNTVTIGQAPVDAAAGANALAIGQSSADSAAGANALSIGVALTDSAEGTDTAQANEYAETVPADDAIGSESLGLTLPLTDTAEGAEALTLAQAVADAAVGTEAMGVEFPISDPAEGTDVFELALLLDNAAQGNDELGLVLTAEDSAEGQEALSLAMAVQDAGEGTESIEVGVLIELIDAASGTDAIAKEVESAPPPQTPPTVVQSARGAGGGSFLPDFDRSKFPILRGDKDSSFHEIAIGKDRAFVTALTRVKDRAKGHDVISVTKHYPQLYDFIRAIA